MFESISFLILRWHLPGLLSLSEKLSLSSTLGDVYLKVSDGRSTLSRKNCIHISLHRSSPYAKAIVWYSPTEYITKFHEETMNRHLEIWIEKEFELIENWNNEWKILSLNSKWPIPTFCWLRFLVKTFLKIKQVCCFINTWIIPVIFSLNY